MEPKDNPLRLHDVKLQRLSQQLSGNGLYRYTVNQLYFNASRKAVRGRGCGPVAALTLMMFPVVILTVTALAADLPILLLPVALIVLGWTIYFAYRISTRHTRRIDPPMDRTSFHTVAVEGWRQTYGQDLPGLVRDRELSNLPEHSSTPVLVVLAPKRSALAALRINDVVNRHRVTLAYSFDQVPPDVPIALLHDVSVAGYHFAGQARATFGQRVVTDLTPRPKAARTAAAALRLRQPRAADDVLGWLRASRLLDDDEVTWLAKGWWTPIESVRPSNLINRVTAAVNRNADPDERAAAAVGFMSWPTAR
ncbi:hypothetical protein Vau01_075120 [Virgisporangium aurantiacum]|uniref:Uncharacterized protein n=1 Tax=Virgisporangium aurantiacum TaxID=175570 RepID=A0A8J4E3D9_9ACTN|nr:hypothetical protein Vau01_075120 [Virgisporangium aurantiacum]